MINICLLGDSAVGKTTFFQTYKNNEYTPSEAATIGITKNTLKEGDVTINVSKLIILFSKDNWYSWWREIW